ncbi:nucleotide-binding universal stress UspA family protein [Streptomyces sp. V3I8]|uniref:universal stress protein n=1 Tax=Streptomyces sp. V3I8 TaxID=3042279 RepID=UPI0027866E96|nr:universal stress protein [Streptomyces sp. V3I8]MDQ1034451.1 nucleotide-binding universal stress UspA family protein [Streptomyces sp. V3I8]
MDLPLIVGAHGSQAGLRAADRAVDEAATAWRCPAYEGIDHLDMAGEPERRHRERAAATLHAVVRDGIADHAGVPVPKATAEGPARRVLLRRSAGADMIVVGVRRRNGHLGLRLGPVGHILLHHADCPVAIVPRQA